MSPSEAPHQRVIAGAIRDMTARRLARALLPLPLLLLAGITRVLQGDRTQGLLLAVGALVCALAMLFYGMGAVGRTLGPGKAWTRFASAAGSLPWIYGVWVLGFPGLHTWVGGVPGRAQATLWGLFFVAAGAWVLAAQWRLSELKALAAAMTMPSPEERAGGAGQGAARGG